MQSIIPLKMREIQFYDFDLAKPADQRWGPIFDQHKDLIPTVRCELEKILNGFGFATALAKPVFNITSEDNILYYDEICYIASRIGMDPYQILLMQLVYETSSACTASVLNVGGKEFFFRTMDWPLLWLKDITVGLNVKNNGKLIGKVTTWLGYVGFLTATNTTHNYTMTINYRRTQEISITALVKNFYRTVTMRWPIGYLVRHIIESNIDGFSAGSLLSTAELISPCYITVYTPNNNTMIITRDCDKAVNVRYNELVQTNCDWDKTEPNILYSVERVAMIKRVQKELNSMTNLPSKDVLNLLLRYPVLNEETVYVHFQYDNEFRTLC